jgi:ABC-type uncharacterized transport system substrate-binding protein
VLCCIATPSVVPGQQIGRVYRLGILEAVPATRNRANLDSLRKGLRELGYIEGQNLLIDYRSADGRAERFQELAAELVASKVDLILTRGTPQLCLGASHFSCSWDWRSVPTRWIVVNSAVADVHAIII